MQSIYLYLILSVIVTFAFLIFIAAQLYKNYKLVKRINENNMQKIHEFDITKNIEIKSPVNPLNIDILRYFKSFKNHNPDEIFKKIKLDYDVKEKSIFLDYRYFKMLLNTNKEADLDRD